MHLQNRTRSFVQRNSTAISTGSKALCFEPEPLVNQGDYLNARPIAERIPEHLLARLINPCLSVWTLLRLIRIARS